MQTVVYEGVTYDGYNFDMKTNTVTGKKTDIIKPNLNSKGYYYFRLWKNNKEKKVFIHRLVYQMHNPDENIKGCLIDHIDRDPSNNNIKNLRKCTRSQNAQNSLRSNTTSKYKGVDWQEKRQLWRVRYVDDNKTSHWVGRFESETEAGQAYDEAVKNAGLDNGFRPLNKNLYPNDFM